MRRGEHEQAVVDALADGVLVVGEDGRVVSCNAAASEPLGVPRSALLGAPPPLEVGAPGDLLHSSVGAAGWRRSPNAPTSWSRSPSTCCSARAGASTVRQLVEAQGGTVAAANRPGGGAVLSFTLPLTTAPGSADSAAVG